jgi:hypothetical protein
MKVAIQKYRDDTFINKIALYTVRAIVVLLCFTAIIAAFVIIGTVLGELVWIVIPART